MKLNTHIHLVPKSRMCGAIPPLPQHTFMVWCSVKAVEQVYNYPTICRWGSYLPLTRSCTILKEYQSTGSGLDQEVCMSSVYSFGGCSFFQLYFLTNGWN